MRAKSTSTLIDTIGQFTTIPNSVIKMWPQLGEEAFQFFVYLRYRSNERDECWPSYETIAADTGIGRNRIARAIKSLEDNGLLSRQKRFSNSTIYRLHLPIPATSSTESGLMEESPVVPNRASSSTESGLPVVPNQDANKTHLTRLNEQESINTAEKYKKRTAEAMRKGAIEHMALTAQIETEFHISPNWNTKSAADFLNWLKERPPSQHVTRFAEWWRTVDWRGKGGQPPTLWNIRELWPQAFVPVPSILDDMRAADE